MPDHLDSLGRACFQRCSALKSIVVPEGIAVLDTNTFLGNYALEKISLPSTLQTIKGKAFDECEAIDTILIACAIPPTLEEEAFFAFTSTLVVPCDAAEDYHQHAIWGQFQNIVDDCDETAIEDIFVAPTDETHKLIRDGQLLIERDGKTYTLTGQEIK